MTFENINDLIANQNSENKLFSDSPLLRLSELPSGKSLKRGSLDKIHLNPNEIWIECRSISNDIAKNAILDVLFPFHTVEQSIHGKVILKQIHIKLTTESDCLPCGYTAVCLLHFTEGVPKILAKLRPETQKPDYDKYEIFYLTQRSVYEKMQSFIKQE